VASTQVFWARTGLDLFGISGPGVSLPLQRPGFPALDLCAHFSDMGKSGALATTKKN